MAQITVRDLSKTYRVAQRKPGLLGATKGLFARDHRLVDALESLSFDVEEGELVGLIGPNGAGKSTLIKILCGILEPSAGYCLVRGRVPWKDRLPHVATIGVVFGQRTQLWWDLPVIDSFELLRDIYRVPEAKFRETLDRLVELMRIERILDQPVRQLSLGQRMRCDIVAALLHRPSVLFLDEPTIGLDAVSKLAVRDFIAALNREERVTILLATHDMHDIEALADRVLIIGNGRLLRDGNIEDMRQERAERRLIVDFAEHTVVRAYPNTRTLSQQGRRLTLSFDPRTVSPHVLINQITAEHEIEDISLEDPPIEEIIARFYTVHGVAEG